MTAPGPEKGSRVDTATRPAEPPGAQGAGSLRIIPEDWIHPLDLDRYFDRRAPLEVDVGCGKGRFLLARAASHPHINFLGIERKLVRVRKVERKALRRGLSNIRLLRADAAYVVKYLIPPDIVSTYYIFFPDPWPKKRHHHHRIMDADFIRALHRTLRNGGAVHFATDHQPYFKEVERRLQSHPGFEIISPFTPADEEKTDFELLFAGRTLICRLSVRKVSSRGSDHTPSGLTPSGLQIL